MASDKKLDPRFDPAFQRGYSERNSSAHSAAVRSARNVDALRNDAEASRAVTADHRRAATANNGGGLPSEPSPQRDHLQPQSHYVDDAGTVDEPTPATRTKSLTRNPWIYALWAVGVAAFAGGIFAQTWAYSELYSQQGLSADEYGLISSVQAISPVAMNLGATCLAAALAIHAISWIRKNQ